MKTSLWGQKSDLYIFSEQVLNRENPEERFKFDGNNFFGQTSETGQYYKTVLLLKISHIQLNLACLVF